MCVCVCLGEITTTALLDREVKSEYILIVRAVDGGVGPLQKTGIATVTADSLIHYRQTYLHEKPKTLEIVRVSRVKTKGVVHSKI